ncbi:D-amino-acid oxidase [Marasmius fiardii PR-910]|nr:D-amino-acid oxidase [Marasmius fiardii PR-910]
MATTVRDRTKHVVVIGAGVAGLTTSLILQERGGYTVSIVAETLPTDPKSIKYTSLWAGAEHVTHTHSDDQRREIQLDTFKKLWDLSEPGGAAEHCLMRIHQEEHFWAESDTSSMAWYPDFKEIPNDRLVTGATHGVEFTTLTVDPPRYTAYLLSRFLAAGGSITRGSVQHINELLEGGAGVYSDNKKPTTVDAIVVCNGIGARTLGGIDDKDVYPIRGQTVLVRAPWVKFGRTISTAALDKAVYILPRRSGNIILGGTFGENDWYPAARAETTEDIVQSAFEICPELAPPEIRAQRTPTVEDVKAIVLESGCGLRPARKGGVRLETLFFQLEDDKKEVPVITNYGHGGSGFQMSWGSATIAVGLLEKALSKAEAS